MIEIKNITKTYHKGYGKFTALDNVSLNIEKGEFLLVTGSSGAGKSTLLNTIGGLVRPDSGDILFQGMNIYSRLMNEIADYRKKNVGFMFQQFHLMPYLTINENIKLACHNKEQFQNIEKYLKGCSLSGLERKYPSELSVGEKQRVAFIRAIITSPDILLADEPTGNLDPGNSSALMVLAEEYHKKGGTVVLVSHDPLASKYATRSLRMDKGRIVA